MDATKPAMDPKTEEALRASIEKWKRNAVAETPDEYSTRWRDCALCLLYYEASRRCDGCPVDEAGHRTCLRTPYDDAIIARDRWLDEPDSQTAKAAAHEAARAEVSFLESLLPTP
jgi:hypothetical protein